MTKSSKQELETKRAYNARPENVKKRVLNNAARRELIRDGRVRVGDSKDVDHARPLDKGGTNARDNLRVQSQTDNRGWRKGAPELYGKKK